MFKASSDVLRIVPGICGWKCSSLIKCCPWWMKSSCGGSCRTESETRGARDASRASSSSSTLRSQMLS
eukprot:scaffold111_cov252-Pinguiococcus_pyrenoidosus.AAC.18